MIYLWLLHDQIGIANSTDSTDGIAILSNPLQISVLSSLVERDEM